MSLNYENQFYSKKVKYIVGCDEAGRGCLLGPVFAAAVILPKGFKSDLINDSKKISEKQREKAFQIIIENAISWAVAFVDAKEIDEINILNASRKAMELAINKLNHSFDMILTDAVKMKVDIPFEAVIHGDAKAQCIAAASIIAKVSRDHWCYDNDSLYPLYNIKRNKGYGTKDHLEALGKYGPVEGLHRFSYSPVKESLIKKVKLF